MEQPDKNQIKLTWREKIKRTKYTVLCYKFKKWPKVWKIFIGENCYGDREENINET